MLCVAVMHDQDATKTVLRNRLPMKRKDSRGVAVVDLDAVHPVVCTPRRVTCLEVRDEFRRDLPVP